MYGRGTVKPFIKISLSTVIAVTLAIIIPATTVLSMTRSEYNREQEVLFYDPNFNPCVPGEQGAAGAAGGPASDIQSTGDNEKNLQIIYNYFLAKGLRDIHAAAIVGNIFQESGGNPLLYQVTGRTFDGDPATIVGPNGPGRGTLTDAGMGKAWGLVQWDPGAAALYWQEQAGVQGDIKQLGVQLDVIWWQLQNLAPTSRRNVLAALQATNTVEEAVRTFCRLFEGAGIPNYPRRDAAARKALTYPVDPSLVPASSTGATPGTTAGGGASGGANCAPGAGTAAGGATGQVNADGYAFPVAVKKNEAYNFSRWPCSPVCHHDRTGAIDITKTPGNDSGTGIPVIAIRGGTLMRVRNSYSGQAGCNTFQLRADDGFYYWYGHIQQPVGGEGTTVRAGQQVAVIGERRCTGNGSAPHLHIDRGWPKGQTGGNVGSRDPNFPQLIDQLYQELP